MAEPTPANPVKPPSKAEMQRLEEYVRTIGDLMGLKDWELVLIDYDHTVQPYDSEHTVEAYCDINYGKKLAAMSFHPTWPERSVLDLRDSVVHELVHCHLEPLRWAFTTATIGRKKREVHILRSAFSDPLEMATDGIATAWAKKLPLPLEIKNGS